VHPHDSGDAEGPPVRDAPARIPNHRIPVAAIEALARGSGDESTVALLRDAERSWRFVGLRTFLDAVKGLSDATGPLDPVRDAWALLTKAHRHAPVEVEEVIRQPSVGVWVAHTLRRIRQHTSDEAPIWVDVGYLHALAAASAIRAGIPARIGLALSDGVATIPGLGCVRLPHTARWQRVELRTDGTTAAVYCSEPQSVVTVGGTDPGWVGLRRLVTTDAGVTLTVTVDDLDPYRNLLRPTPPDPLSTEEFVGWQGILDEAWRILRDTSPARARAIARGLSTMVPLPASERYRPLSASAGEAFGSATISAPDDAAQLAVTLVHEFQHIKLGGLLHLAVLHDDDISRRLYAPWRDDPRPLGGLLQGAYAFHGIADFWRVRRLRVTGREAASAQFEFALWRRQTWRTLQTLRAQPGLTDLGRVVVSGLLDAARRWWSEPVPESILSSAHRAAADHRALWRLYHLRPAPAAVETLAEQGRAGLPSPHTTVPDATVAPDPAARWLDTRAVLMRWHLDEPDELADSVGRDALPDRVSGATRADVAFVLGRSGEARELYLAELATDPTRPTAWVGLGLTAPARDGRPILKRPELVRAVYDAVATGPRPPDSVLSVSRWLGGITPPVAEATRWTP
jgi:HEXXH motif-containing protein